MATTTSNQQIRIPQSTDDPDVVDDLGNAVADIEKKLVMVFNNTADRTSRVSAPTEGMLSYMKDTNKLEKFDGAAWVNVLGSTPNFTTGTAVPSNATGSDGDVFFKVDA